MSVMSLNERLQKENAAKDREIRKLNKDVQQYEQTIMNLRNEVSLSKYHTPEVSKIDAEVMAARCCSGAECGDWEPVKDYGTILCEETRRYQERIEKIEGKLKSSSNSVNALRKTNVSLTKEVYELHTACAALVEQCRAATMRGQFKDDIIREMRRQLQQAKAKSKEAEAFGVVKSKTYVDGDHDFACEAYGSFESLEGTCVLQQPRRKREAATASVHRSLSDDCRSPRLVGSGDNLLSIAPQ